MKRIQNSAETHGLPRVRRIELSGERPGVRMALTIALLALAVVALGYALTQLLAKEPGWTEITARPTSTDNCAADFTLRYRLGGGASAEAKRISELYTEASERAFQVFHPTRRFDGVHNLAFLNAHPNEAVELEPELYEALRLMVKHAGEASPLPYLAPVYAEYDSVFRSVEDIEAAACDPMRSADARAFVEAVLGYIRDRGTISLELLGERRATLHVSDDYMRFAEENEIASYLDLYWMKNAFAADLIAERLLEGGYTHGYLASTDGFTRNLDDSGEAYAVGMDVRQGNEIRRAGTFTYTGPLALVSLSDYPVAGGVGDYYYEYEDGVIRTPYIGADDGLCHAALHELLLYSGTEGCAELVLAVYPIYVAEPPFASGALPRGIHAIYAESGKLTATEAGALLEETA